MPSLTARTASKAGGVPSTFETLAILGGEQQMVSAASATALLLFIGRIPPWMWEGPALSECVDVESAIAGSHVDDEDCRLPSPPLLGICKLTSLR
ncbi:MAG TPA: hypothetical protein DGT23_24075 [Micromonosporaceae bacterium]|nr:hypothetical protein [Micromonosporaceae bacterium]